MCVSLCCVNINTTNYTFILPSLLWMQCSTTYREQQNHEALHGKIRKKGLEKVVGNTVIVLKLK